LHYDLICAPVTLIIVLFLTHVSPTHELSSFPYTTLFRSGARGHHRVPPAGGGAGDPRLAHRAAHARGVHLPGRARRGRRREQLRSEEHTSELQSRENLVCRLLLEKKKIS